MKLITATVFLFVGVQLGFCATVDEIRDRPGLHKNVGPLDFHKHSTCPETSTRVYNVRMGPCYDTPGCTMPKCCGIISGAESMFTMSYIATKNMTTGKFDGDLGGLGLANADNPEIEIDIPLILVPGFVAGYDPNICHSSKCPQEEGKEYTLNLDFQFPTSALTSAFVHCDFVAHGINEKGETLYCGGLLARLVNPDLIDSVVDVVKNTVENPLDVNKNIRRLGLGRVPIVTRLFGRILGGK